MVESVLERFLNNRQGKFMNCRHMADNHPKAHLDLRVLKIEGFTIVNMHCKADETK